MDRAARIAFARAAYRIGGTAIESIKTVGGERGRDELGRFTRAGRGDASAPGTPPHTRKRRRLPRSIRYFANSEGAVIGPVASKADQSAVPHEFGGEYKGADYPERPFMWPALKENLASFAGDFAGSLGE
jgi:hypothetical protein